MTHAPASPSVEHCCCALEQSLDVARTPLAAAPLVAEQLLLLFEEHPQKPKKDNAATQASAPSAGPTIRI